MKFCLPTIRVRRKRDLSLAQHVPPVSPSFGSLPSLFQIHTSTRNRFNGCDELFERRRILRVGDDSSFDPVLHFSIPKDCKDYFLISPALSINKYQGVIFPVARNCDEPISRTGQVRLQELLETFQSC